MRTIETSEDTGISP